MPPKNVARSVSEETREKIRAANRARFAALTPEQRDAQLARIGRKPKVPTGPAARPPAADPPPAPASSGGPRNPLDDAPGDRPSPARPLQGRVGGPPPRFSVPDVDRLDLGGPPEGGPGPTIDQGPGFTVSQEQVADLISLPFNLISVRRGRHWKLLDEERDMLAEPLTRQVNENALLARGLGIAADPLVIVFGFGFVIWARLEEDRSRARNARPVGPDADRPSPSRGAPPPGGGGGDGPVRRGPVGGGGRLNGYDVGAVHDPGTEAVAAEDPGRPLEQAL